MSQIDRKHAAVRRIRRLRASLAIATALFVLTACRSSTERADGYEALFDRQLAANNYTPALQLILKAVKTDENEPRRWLKLANLQLAMNRPSDAASSYLRALELQPSNIEALQNLALLTVRLGQFDIASRFIDPLLVLQPDDLAGLIASTSLAIHDHRWPDAEALCTRIIGLAPTREEGYVLRARLFELTNRLPQAVSLLEQRQALDPTNRDVPSELMALYRRHGYREDIRRTAIRLMTLFPDNPGYALEGARAYHAMKRDDDARRIVGQLSQRYAGNISVMTAVAGLWRDIEPHDMAVNEIAAAAGRSVPRVRNALADVLTGMGEPARAVTLLATAAAAPVSVDTIDTHASYLRAIKALGRADAVDREVQAILDFDPDNPTALLVRARIRMAKGDYLKAATDAGVVANDDETNAEAALLIAEIYDAQGNALLAAKAYATARDTFPDNAHVLQAQTQWMLRRHLNDQALQQTASYVHAHPRQSAGWLVHRDVCVAAGDATCTAQAKKALATFKS
jgi:tetratricopeptide (TPR) repeat protein